MMPTVMTPAEMAQTMGAILHRARVDPAEFLRFLLAGPGTPGNPMAEVHASLQKHLTDHRLALVELPRDHGKTTQVCLRILWELGNNPNLRVKVVCASEAVARDRSRFLRSNIEQNDRLKMVFPNLRKSAPWLATGFSVKREANVLGPTVAAFGVGAASTGTRADLLVCDDVVDVKAIWSKAHRDRTSEDFTNNLLNLLEPAGRFWGLSTPWHADDLNARLKKNPSYALFRRAVGPNLEPVWREHWPKAMLRRRQAEIGSAAFARGYLLTPVAVEELLIRPEWLQTWTEVPQTFDRIILSVDPAVSLKPTADASALVVLGKSGAAVYCLAAESRRVASPALVEWIERMTAQWNPREIVFESNGAFDAVRELLSRHASFGHRVVGVTQHHTKASRVAAFAVAVQAGSFRVACDGSQRVLAEEMLGFPFAERDDLLDAAATGAMRLLAGKREPRMWI
jgi:phage terminase large subunit-like protein